MLASFAKFSNLARLVTLFSYCTTKLENDIGFLFLGGTHLDIPLFMLISPSVRFSARQSTLHLTQTQTASHKFRFDMTKVYHKHTKVTSIKFP